MSVRPRTSSILTSSAFMSSSAPSTTFFNECFAAALAAAGLATADLGLDLGDLPVGARGNGLFGEARVLRGFFSIGTRASVIWRNSGCRGSVYALHRA